MERPVVDANWGMNGEDKTALEQKCEINNEENHEKIEGDGLATKGEVSEIELVTPLNV